MNMLPRNDGSMVEPEQKSSGTFLQEIARSIAGMPEDKVFARWYNNKGQVESTRTFHGLWAASGEIAHLLRVEWGMDKGDRVVLAFNFGLRFFAVFLGCLRAGIIAVPVYPPNPAKLKKSLQKLDLIVKSCTPKMILVDPLVNKLRLTSKLTAVATGGSGWPDVTYNCPDVKEETLGNGAPSYFGGWRGGGGGSTAALSKKVKSFDDPSITLDDVAFLQFTSGSTSDPKGVMLTFGNLGHNIGCVLDSSNMQIAARGGSSQDERTWFSWLPTFHDMGLIQGTLAPFVAGWTAAYCSPISFIRRPLIWLELMSKEKSQMTAAPDFAFRLCARKWSEMKPPARAALDLDLKHVMFMQSAAEPVRASTVRDFTETFAIVGLPPSAPNMAYGLAEHTVGCSSFSPNLEGAALSSIADDRLQSSGDVAYSLSIGVTIKIVDPETCRELPAGETGEMWVSSDSVAAGYWGKPELTRETFQARIDCDTTDRSAPPLWAEHKYLRTGDLGRIDAEGLLYVEGRRKDLIIVNGRNIYPQDVEFAAQDASTLVRPGCVAAFSETELGGSLQIVMEVRKTSKKDSGVLREALETVRKSVMNECGLFASVVVAVKEKTIPKTTSGKIQRRKARTLLHNGGLDVVYTLSDASGSTTTAAASSTPSVAANELPVLETLQPAPDATAAVAEAKPEAVAASKKLPASPEPDTSSQTSVDDSSSCSDDHTTEQESREQQQKPYVLERGAEDAEGTPRDAEGECPLEEEGASDSTTSTTTSTNILPMEKQKGERLDDLVGLVVVAAGEVLEGRTISPDQALFDAGLDSISAEEFVRRLQERLLSEGWVSGEDVMEEAVSSTTVFDCPTPRHIAEHVEDILSRARGEPRIADTNEPGASLHGTTNPRDSDGEGDPSLAVVGISCRYPGGCDSPEAFWDFLRKGAHATSCVPSDRWSTSFEESDIGGEEAAAMSGGDDGDGKTRGAFLSEGEAWAFDNSFFGVSPAEARVMDPMQRMMLEVGYEALHRAGYNRDSLRGSDTGVYVGAGTPDWATLLAEEQGPPRGPYTSTGVAPCMLSNRLSYALGLMGPSMTVDTACSSSLVALRQACLHLRDGVGAGKGGPRVALVGGINLLLSPVPFELCTKTGMLAKDGRSKPFSADADGYGRGEGCGAVVLKRLDDAMADGDKVLAVIKGSATTHNGRSATLTAPNGVSQRATMTAALREANLSPAEVSYVEAHGTGTPLGDPVEFGALKAVYGAGRSEEHPLVVGAVKSNIGHLEGASGMSGLIKTILVLAHGSAPPNLHASKVNPRIDLASLPAVLPGAGEQLRLGRRSSDKERGTERGDDEASKGQEQEVQVAASSGQFYGGVNSFGFGGANAHVVVEGRAGAFSGGASREGRSAAKPVKGMAFLFTGQGSQYPGMGRQLYETDAEFRAVVDACDEELAEVLPRRLLSVLYGDNAENADLLATTRYAQPALFAVECGTAAALRAAGIMPSAVIGHSLGELAAACVAGVMTLREGVRLVAERGRLMEEALPAPHGMDVGPECMAALRAAESTALAAVSMHGDGLVSVAAVNGPDSLTLAGPRRLLELVAAAALSPPPGPVSSPDVAQAGGDLPADRFRILQGVSRAFHSPAMTLAALGTQEAARKVSLRDPAIPLASNVTGRLAKPGELTDPAYWSKHVRGTVRFHDGLTALVSPASNHALSEDITTFIEVGPSALLCKMGQRALRDADGGGAKSTGTSRRWIATMSPEERIAGKSGLGHVVGAVRGVHFSRSKFPLSYGAGATTKRDRSLPASQAPRSDKRKEKEQARPALQLLNTKWLCVGELSSSSEAQGDLVEVDAEAAAAVAAEEGLIRSSSLRPAQKQEVVWLLAGHTEKSYAEISEVVSVEGCTGALGETQRENLAHMLTLGPGAAGGAPAAMGRLKRLLRGGAAPELNHIVYVVGESDDDHANKPMGGSSLKSAFQTSGGEISSFLAFAEAVAESGELLPEVVVVSRGVHACLEDDKVKGWAMAWLPGALRSLALKYPHLKTRHVDLSGEASSPSSPSPSLSATRELVELIEGGSVDAEPEVCIRAGKVLAPRLEAKGSIDILPSGEGCLLAGQVSPQGTYVITAGTGSIGLDLALRLARAGAGGLVLLSRHGKDFVDELEAGSASAMSWGALDSIVATKVLVLRCDVTVGGDVISALAAAASAEAGLPPVRGILHAAGPQQGGTDEEGLTLEERRQRFLEAKVVGALNLSDGAARMRLNLDFLVFFSSASAVLGLAGDPGFVGEDTGFAAASSCLDGLAWHLNRSRGWNVRSVQYGPWVQAASSSGDTEALSASGHVGLTNDEGFSALGSLIRDVSSATPSSPAVSAVVLMHWDRYASAFPGVPPLIATMVSVDPSKEGAGEADNAEAGRQLNREEIVEVLLEAARQVTDWDGEIKESDELMEQAGMDSLQTVEFHRIICTQLGRSNIPQTLYHDFPTAGEMAAELVRTAPPPSAASKRTPATVTAAPSTVAATPAAVGAAAGEGPSPTSGIGAKPKPKPAGGAGHEEKAGEGTEWEEEQYLDNVLYLIYKVARAFVAYLYIACVLMLPAWIFFLCIRKALRFGGLGVLIFATLPLAWLVFGLSLCLLVAASKWFLIGRIKPGESFTTHSVRHLKWWTVQRLLSFSGLLFVDGIRRGRLVVWYYRLLGAKLGRDVFLNTVKISDPDLVTVGDGSTINEHVDMTGHEVKGNRVVFGSGVSIGSGTVVLPSAHMSPEAQVGDNRIVGALATSAHPTRRNSTPLAPPTSLAKVFLQVVADLVSLYFVAVTVGGAALVAFICLAPMLDSTDVFPGDLPALDEEGKVLAFASYAAAGLLSPLYLPVLMVFSNVDVTQVYSFLKDTVLGDLPLVLTMVSFSAVVFYLAHMALTVLLKWVLVQRLSQVDGVVSTTSWLGFRKQITDRLIMSANVRSVLLFTGNSGNSLWLAALGGSIGSRVCVMLKKNVDTEPELLALGDDTHVGFPASTYCSVYTAPNTFTLRNTVIGERVLIGAGAVTLPGVSLPDGAALGPNTRLAKGDAVREGALHVGSPAPVVAGRYKSPPRVLSTLERVLYVVAPVPLAMMSTWLTLSAVFWPLLGLSWAAEALGEAWMACFLAPFAWLGLGLSLAVTGALVKWIVIGKQIPSGTKLWSLYRYRTLLVLYVQIHANILFVDVLRRGRLYNCYTRLLGASVGRDADVATSYFTDHDLVSIGDRAVVQEDSIPHPQFYFEGDVSCKPVSIGAGSYMGARSILLGGGAIKAGESLETLTVV